MKKIVSLIGLTAILMFVAYMESSHPNNQLPILSFLNGTPAEEPASAQANDENEVINGIVPSLELKFVDQETVDGYTIETYREYEVYKDENKNVIKSIPTDHYEYLKYEK